MKNESPTTQRCDRVPYQSGLAEDENSSYDPKTACLNKATVKISTIALARFEGLRLVGEVGSVMASSRKASG